jgi:hypothetical protein
MQLFKKMAHSLLLNFNPLTGLHFALRANYLCNRLEFLRGGKYDYASIFQPPFNTFLASMGRG